MKGVRELVEAKVMEGNITAPYTWTTGPAVGAFLTELRDNKRITGVKCSKCGRVVCPPRDVCPKCFVSNDDYVEVGPAGTVVGFSVVHVPNDDQPAEPPYALVMINLDGADTNLIHILGEVDLDEIKPGMRVEAAWSDERAGLLTDIKYFKPV